MFFSQYGNNKGYKKEERNFNCNETQISQNKRKSKENKESLQKCWYMIHLILLTAIFKGYCYINRPFRGARNNIQCSTVLSLLRRPF